MKKRIIARWLAAGLLSVGMGCSASNRSVDAGGDGSLGEGGVSGASIAGASGAAVSSRADASGDGAGAIGRSSGGGRGGVGGSNKSAETGDGTCVSGTTTTTWAGDCPTAAVTKCVAGTWTDPGSTTGDPLQCESAHFAVHCPAGTITAEQCSAATATLENVVWAAYFGAPIFFPEPYCTSAAKYKASIVVRSGNGLTGGGWGNGYMGMWIGPAATADHWGLAHEFMHAVQAQTKGLKCGDPANYCGWIFESHANFMPHQIAEFRADVHCSEMLVNAPHFYLGSTRNRYCNWQFMEYLKDKYCYKAVNDIWNATTTSNDPFNNIAAARGWDIGQLNDFFGEWAMHNVTWDYQDPPSAGGGNQGPTYRSKYGAITDLSKTERRLRTVRLEPLDAANRRYVVPTLQAPQRWGYNIIRLYPDGGATDVTVTFRGVIQKPANSDWRWGLVATDAAITTPRYSALQRGSDGQIKFCIKPGESLFLVVMGTPSVQQHIVWDQLYPTIYRYPYMVQLLNAQPEGYQGNAPNPSTNGSRWSNGGGWVASEASVAQGAYVGPYAAVLGGTVGAAARIEDHATILKATISSGVVGGLTVLANGFSVSGSAKVAVAWSYSPSCPGQFEQPQSVSGSAELFGDLEYRGANLSKTNGKYCGFVDSTVDNNCATTDLNVAPPYAWRP